VGKEGRENVSWRTLFALTEGHDGSRMKVFTIRLKACLIRLQIDLVTSMLRRKSA
jgi:hypothetical protein